jgi:DNA-binding NtrC family response regulator
MIADKVLIVDDEVKIRKIFAKILSDEGYQVTSTENGLKGIQQLKQFKPQIVLLDQNMPGMNGIETLLQMKEMDPDVLVIIITAHGEVSLAVDAMKKGAFDYIEKPVDNDRLVLLLNRASHHYSLQHELSTLKNKISRDNSFDGIVAMSDAMKKVVEQARSVSETDASVLVTGESGVGKEIITRAIHNASPRKNHPFIAVNCGAIPVTLIESELFGHEKGAFTDAKETKSGRFEQANGGTLFLDELGELPLEAQVKLLRVLEERKITRLGGKKEIPVDVRIISATNKILEDRVQRGEFRLDLLYRLNVFTIHIPPLRERIEDIPLLTDTFISDFNVRLKLNITNVSAQAMKLIADYSWPGNIRDLQNALQSAMILAKSGTITTDHLPARLKSTDVSAQPEVNLRDGLDENLKRHHEKLEKDIILEALKTNNYNRTETANHLKVSRKTLFNKIKKYGLG